jgi:hypothetical protein
MINKRNAQFYSMQATVMKERMSDEAVLQIAVMDVNSEETRGVALSTTSRREASWVMTLRKTSLRYAGPATGKFIAPDPFARTVSSRPQDLNEREMDIGPFPLGLFYFSVKIAVQHDIIQLGFVSASFLHW